MIKSLHIGGYDYQVVISEDVRNADNQPLYGAITYGKFLIELDKDGIADGAAAMTLLHEAIHAILKQAGIDHQEGLVVALEYGLFQLIRDNPQLVRMIRAGAKLL